MIPDVQATMFDNSRKVERRYEILQAHLKHGKTIREVVKEYKVSTRTYYYWLPRYEKEGILGLVDRKPGARIPYNKTPIEQEMEIIKIAAANTTLDANDIFEIASEKHGFKKSVWTIERILKKHELNRKRGRRSKKEIEKKRGIVQRLKQ